MSPPIGGKSTRSSSRGRSKKKEPQSAALDARAALSLEPSLQSPSRSQSLPPRNKNKQASKKVSPISAPVDLSTETDDLSTLASCNAESVQVNSDFEKVSGLNPSKDNVRATHEMGDNRETDSPKLPDLSPPPPAPALPSTTTPASIHPDDPFQSSPEDPWHLTYTELRVMRGRMGTLESVEAATLEFAKQLQALSSRTANTETGVASNTNKIKELGEEIRTLRKTVEDQQNTIQDLNKVKEDFAKKSHQTIDEMNTLLRSQKEQVESFSSIRKDFVREVKVQKEQIASLKVDRAEAKVEAKQWFQEFSDNVAYTKLQDKAYQNRHNIVIIGLPEHDTHSSYSVAMKFFKTELGLKRLRVEVAYRMGRTPSEGSSYSRPLIVEFSQLADHNLVWRKRLNIPQEEGKQKIRIQADLPKQLREDVNLLSKVSKAASTLPEFQSTSVRDYALNVQGKVITPRQLESLPYPLRPSTLATKRSDKVLAFFTKSCPLSNHFPSIFTYQNRTFHTMEQYLAYKRAEISLDDSLMERAAHATDPVEAKSILNALRNKHVQEWEAERENISIEGLRAKFVQNDHLYEYLRDTQDQQLGEASKNPCWGVGMTLEDKDILDTNKWTESGNLLGKLLMRIREELRQPSS